MFLRFTEIDGPAFSAPGAVGAGARFLFAGALANFGSVYYETIISILISKEPKLSRFTYCALRWVAARVGNMVAGDFDCARIEG